MKSRILDNQDQIKGDKYDTKNVKEHDDLHISACSIAAEVK